MTLLLTCCKTRRHRLERFAGVPEPIGGCFGGDGAAPNGHGVLPLGGGDVAAVSNQQIVFMQHGDGHGVRDGKFMQRLDQAGQLHQLQGLVDTTKESSAVAELSRSHRLIPHSIT